MEMSFNMQTETMLLNSNLSAPMALFLLLHGIHVKEDISQWSFLEQLEQPI